MIHAAHNVGCLSLPSQTVGRLRSIDTVGSRLPTVGSKAPRARVEQYLGETELYYGLSVLYYISYYIVYCLPGPSVFDLSVSGRPGHLERASEG